MKIILKEDQFVRLTQKLKNLFESTSNNTQSKIKTHGK